MSLFGPDRLKQLAATIPDLPSGHTNAIVGTVDETGAQIAVVFSKKTKQGEWRAQGSFAHAWETGEDTGSGKFIYSWK